MDNFEPTSNDQAERDQKPDDPPRNKVTVSLNGEPKDIPRGSHTTKEIKRLLGVDPAHDLDIVEDGTFRTLKDNERLVVKAGMEFISHVRDGAAS